MSDHQGNKNKNTATKRISKELNELDQRLATLDDWVTQLNNDLQSMKKLFTSELKSLETKYFEMTYTDKSPEEIQALFDTMFPGLNVDNLSVDEDLGIYEIDEQIDLTRAMENIGIVYGFLANAASYLDFISQFSDTVSINNFDEDLNSLRNAVYIVVQQSAAMKDKFEEKVLGKKKGVEKDGGDEETI